MSTPLILGTAGHIDHGKTALVRALTGVDCDRLPEERERGITIELGFAPLDLPSGRRLGIVDVPGHERLVRTMVAGATGIDLVLFVVAADEGIMPQSREHLAICGLLGVERGVIALTKRDIVAPDLLELARLDVEEELRGSSLEDAPIIAVSALRGDGLEELRATLDKVSGETPPRTLRDGPSWLPVDRVFSMRGFGTVVTGTLRGGPLVEGEPVEILPEGSSRRWQTRIRGLQTYGESRTSVAAGSRCAVNLHGVEVAAVPRGSILATPDRLDYRPRIDAQLTLLKGAPTLRSGAQLSVHIGTTERLARITLLDCQRLEPGQRALATLRFNRPLVTVEGDRFVLRGFGRIPTAGWTIGGGRVLDTAPAKGRRSRPERVADLEELLSGSPATSVAIRLRRGGLRGVRESQLRRDLRSLEGIEGVRVGSDLWLGPQAFAELSQLCVDAVEAHHRQRPEDAWVGLAAVTSHLPAQIAPEAVRAALDAACAERVLEAAASGVRRPGHAAHAADPLLSKRVQERIEPAGLAPPTLDALAAELGVEVRQLRPVVEHLAREGRLVRVSSALFFAREDIEALRERLIRHLEKHGEITPASYKDLTGQTRKYTVPLMEFFDSRKLTVRRGNIRVLRSR